MNKVYKNLIIFGTRPEAIKMAPIIKVLKNSTFFETKVCVTAQHREMLDQVLAFFEIDVDYDLDLMKPEQGLNELTGRIITDLEKILSSYKPDYVFVHGDTTTSMAAGLAAFHTGATVCHVEAGLRTYNKLSPFPEELNRQITSRIAQFHFAPTAQSRNNLLSEGIPDNHILVTGNTVIDALLDTAKKMDTFSSPSLDKLKKQLDLSKRFILVTGHRRENHGNGFINLCAALKSVQESNPDTQIVFPVHLNPKVKDTIHKFLSDTPNILLINPLSYPEFIWLMSKSYLIITDSGGVQEEAPSLGKPVLVIRENTERPEAVDAGTVILVGTKPEKIINETNSLLNDDLKYRSMSELHNPYGDGKASIRILNFLENLVN